MMYPESEIEPDVKVAGGDGTIIEWEMGNGHRRKRHSSEFKAKVALEALKGQKTLNELSSEYGLHPVQIAQWKRQAHEGLADVFAGLTTAVDNGVACSGLKP